MYKNTPYTLRALVLGTLLATTGLGFAYANTTTTTNAPTTAVISAKVESPVANNLKAVATKTDISNTDTNKEEASKFDASKAANPIVVNTSIGRPQDIQKIRAHIFSDVPTPSVL